MEHIHRQEMVHGDIKPENITVDSSGQVRIMDLGVAVLLYERLQDSSYPALLSTRPDAILRWKLVLKHLH